METAALIIVCSLWVLLGAFIYHTRKTAKINQQVPNNTIVNQVVDLKPLIKVIDELPTKVLQSITSSANTHKGALGELIGYINLRANYDRVIPLGTIVDIMAIKFQTETEPGHVDFIDIKTGDKSRLSKEQRELQKLIEEKKINFIKLKVDTQSNEDTTKPNS